MSDERALRTIADEIRRDWTGMYFYASPYVDAMSTLDKITDSYGPVRESGKSIVHYFLANTSTWRGDVARRVKAELKAMMQ